MDKSMRSSSVATSKDRELVITRIFDAPPSLVFKMWTDPEHMKRWAAPRGLTVTHGKGEMRPGGAWRSCMHTPAGEDLWLSGVYQEIVPDRKISFTHAWEDGNGKRGHETLVTITLVEHAGKTKLTLHQAVFDSVASRDGHDGGWGESLDKLAEELAVISPATSR
jgi:uncharacterized protein YndB with AHSA1/START domain